LSVRCAQMSTSPPIIGNTSEPLGNFGYDGILEHIDHIRADIQSRELVSRGADRPDAA
jgi:hypothetical protein